MILAMFASERQVDSCEEAWRFTLASLVEHGRTVGALKPTQELLGFDVSVLNPRDRGGNNPVRPFPIVSAVARFVWMMAGNDRLADIMFYEPMVARYTDDQLVVPGSNYGSRLRKPTPGVDQVAGAIARLRGGDEAIAGLDGALRRAANVIWRPEDAVRPSKDIPCAFGVFYFPRDGALFTQVVMRSNNAMTLLPFNLFEFSLLAEVVATEAGLSLGALRMDAMSMHLYEGDRARTDDVLAITDRTGQAMPAMPSDLPPLSQISLLAQREAELRHDLAQVAKQDVRGLRSRGEGLHEYWRAFLEVLVAHAAAKVGRFDSAAGLAETLPDWCREGVMTHIQKLERSVIGDSEGQLSFMPEKQADLVPLARALADPDRRLRNQQHLHDLLDQIEAEGLTITRKQSLEVERALLDDRVAASARSENDQGSAEDFERLTADEVRAVLRELGFLR